jgi:restriction endonuclease Mrr
MSGCKPSRKRSVARRSGKAIGRSGEQGIDGMIKEDRLGLDVIYIQAKRWENTIDRPDIQQFADALQGQRARKGVFITTSSFSSEATRCYDLVRSYCTQLLMSGGADVSLAQKARGHRDIRTTLIDTQVVADPRLADAVQRAFSPRRVAAPWPELLSS